MMQFKFLNKIFIKSMKVFLAILIVCCASYNVFAGGPTLPSSDIITKLPVALPSLAPITKKNLENKYFAQLSAIDTTTVPPFSTHLLPNEWAVTNGDLPKLIKKEQNNSRGNLLVSVGTVRSFQDILLCTECSGLIVVDVNWRVKAFIDFEVMLLKTTETPIEFKQYILPLKPPETIESRIETLRTRLASALRNRVISPQMGEYYQRHLKDFATLYYSETAQGGRNPILATYNWRDNSDLHCIRYWDSERDFNRLRKLALDGMIIATVGSVFDLMWIRDPIRIIDISNVWDYEQGNFRFSDNTKEPRIIWTYLGGFVSFSSHSGQGFNALYLSYRFVPLTTPEEIARHTFLKNTLKTLFKEIEMRDRMNFLYYDLVQILKDKMTLKMGPIDPFKFALPDNSGQGLHILEVLMQVLRDEILIPEPTEIKRQLLGKLRINLRLAKTREAISATAPARAAP